jgi:hypothetical protein
MKKLILLCLLAAGACAAEDAKEYSADAYTVCSACHLASGEGIPGAFPPIRNRAASIADLDGGREYLISVVSSGLMGTLEADGMTYMGVMPGHQGSMSPETIANALNYLVFSLVDEALDVEPFTGDEVRVQQESLKSASPATAASMRGKLAEQHADEWPR